MNWDLLEHELWLLDTESVSANYMLDQVTAFPSFYQELAGLLEALVTSFGVHEAIQTFKSFVADHMVTLNY